jgi:pyruvate dehydrogenase E2 component (dihydrolipoamide acetyltransferase)
LIILGDHHMIRKILVVGAAFAALSVAGCNKPAEEAPAPAPAPEATPAPAPAPDAAATPAPADAGKMATTPAAPEKK